MLSNLIARNKNEKSKPVTKRKKENETYLTLLKIMHYLFQSNIPINQISKYENEIPIIINRIYYLSD